MASMFRSFKWWKIILCAVLIYTDTYDLLYPNKRAFPPANAGEANVILGLDVIFTGVGLWLIYSGIRAGKRQPVTSFGPWFQRLRRRGYTGKTGPANARLRVRKFSIAPTPETPTDPGVCTVVFPGFRYLPETTITAPFAQLAENTYRLEEGFLCGPISFGDVIETKPTDQEKVLLFRRRVKRGGFKRKCYGIPHRLVDDPRFRALAVEIQKSGGFAAVDFKGLFLIFLPKAFDVDVAAELDRIVRASAPDSSPTSKGEPT
jgi:hypothetical protein